MLVLFSLIVNLYFYLEYSFLLEKVSLLQYQYQILEQNNKFLQYTIQKNLQIFPDSQIFSQYFTIIASFFFIILLSGVIYKTIEFSKKVDDYQVSNVELFNAVLKDTSVERLSDLSLRINEILIRQERLNEMLEHLTKTSPIIVSETATNLANTFFNILN